MMLSRLKRCKVQPCERLVDRHILLDVVVYYGITIGEGESPSIPGFHVPSGFESVFCGDFRVLSDIIPVNSLPFGFAVRVVHFHYAVAAHVCYDSAACLRERSSAAEKRQGQRRNKNPP